MSTNEREPCPCKKKTCTRHGRCEECRAHHKTDPRRPQPYCESHPRRGGRKQRGDS